MSIDCGTAQQNRVAGDLRAQGVRRFRPKIPFQGPLLCAVLLVVLLAIFEVIGISLRINVMNLLGLYLSIGVQSVAYSVFLVGVQFPRELFFPALHRILKRPELIITALAIGFLSFRLLPPAFAFSLVVALLALTQIPWAKASQSVLPGIYLFAGLFTAFGYNIVAVTVRFKPDYDFVLRRADAFFLFGHTVSELSHRFAAMVPGFVTEGLLVWYALMFVQVGAALMLCSTLVSRECGVRFVSTILLAYAITIVIFFAFPTHSPYFTCVDHVSSRLPRAMIEIQEQFVKGATVRWEGGRSPLGPEYYVSFPCMHIAQPLIAMWFLRRWKRIFRLLVFINAILAFAIVILEWHYFVDLLGGAAVAAISLWLVNGRVSEMRDRQVAQ